MSHIQKTKDFVRRNHAALLLLTGAVAGVYVGMKIQDEHIMRGIPDGTVVIGKKFYLPTTPDKFINMVTNGLVNKGL